MRIHRFYIKVKIEGKSFDVSDRDLIHQWKKVFRYNVGSQIIVFNGSGTDYLCVISSLRGLGATLMVLKEMKKEYSLPKRNVCLCMALIKKDNFDLVVQKATEIGVNSIVPILCEHSEKKKLNIERLRKISIEASEQSDRGDIVTIYEPYTFENLFNTSILPQEKIVLHPAEGGVNPEGAMSWRQYKDSTNHMSVAVFVGPEGGFSPKEINLLKSYNVKVISLGENILRSETSAMAISSLFILG